MPAADYEKQLANIAREKAALQEKEKRLKAKMAKEKRAQENHAKMTLGGAVFAVLKCHAPLSDRKALKLYGDAVKAVFCRNQGILVAEIETEYHRLCREAVTKEENEARP